MKRIYITAIPLDSNFAIDSYAAEPVNYTQTLAKPTYWRPKRFVPVFKLPLTETGKPDRAIAKLLAQK